MKNGKEIDIELFFNIITFDIGLSPSLKGSLYICECAIGLLQNPQMSIMKLYQQVGEKHQHNGKTIDCIISHAICEAYERNHLNGFFAQSNGRPYNSEVIWEIAEIFKRYI